MHTIEKQWKTLGSNTFKKKNRTQNNTMPEMYVITPIILKVG